MYFGVVIVIFVIVIRFLVIVCVIVVVIKDKINKFCKCIFKLIYMGEWVKFKW